MIKKSHRRQKTQLSSVIVQKKSEFSSGSSKKLAVLEEMIHENQADKQTVLEVVEAYAVGLLESCVLFRYFG